MLCGDIPICVNIYFGKEFTMFSKLTYAYKRNGLTGISRLIKSALPLGLSTNLTFFKNYGRFINKKNPVYMDEKMLIAYAGEYANSKLVSDCVDKYLVRDIVATKRGGYLVPLLGAYESTSEIDWDALPNKFVIKCNHGCGYNIIVKDKATTDKAEAFSKLEKWLAENYATVSGEMQYKNIKPQIIAEEFLDTGDGKLPSDYKFMCSRGKVLYCLVIAERENGSKRICVNKDFQDLGYVPGANMEDFAHLKPEKYEEMWNIAEKLSEDFPVVRVDLYSVQNKIYFGELTFTPHGCIHKYFSKETQKLLGDEIVL